VHATIPKGNTGYDQYTVPDDCSCRTYFRCLLLAPANIRPWPLVSFFQTSLKNSEFKTTHNTFRDCRVHFFRQPFSKLLYIYRANVCVSRPCVGGSTNERKSPGCCRLQRYSIWLKVKERAYELDTCTPHY